MTIRENICKNEVRMMKERLDRLTELGAPRIIILETLPKQIAELEAGNLTGIGGDLELLDVEVESIENRTGRGGKLYIVYNGSINYFPAARYGRYIKRGC